MIQRLDEVMIYVYDHDKAITFWTKNLDFKVVEDTEEDIACCQHHTI